MNYSSSKVGLNKTATIFMTMPQHLSRASKIENFHHSHQVSNIAIHMNPALHLIHAKVLPMKFQG